eukprot:CAMPEP_0116895848 /NCGR_PEP_ID=MMETSP0467-20121206/5254_1 /TAXON_ID=283647 /ORGANISM="Mesodinium pulex, Strain SPMC105" /LENGTH=61 /DNA_ID=CAMNT_0004566753 /DNA_START=453 /DNA_END=635 /DNA_ORIENTATION=+
MAEDVSVKCTWESEESEGKDKIPYIGWQGILGKIVADNQLQHVLNAVVVKVEKEQVELNTE